MQLIYRIPRGDYENLKLLIGMNLNEILFQRSLGSNPHCSAHMVAVRTPEGRFIRVCTDKWADTEKEAIDCFRLRVQYVENPAYAFRSVSKEPVEIESAVLNLGVLKEIDILEFCDKEGDESVAYDAALLLKTGHSQDLLIGIDNSSMAGDVYFLLDSEEISYRLGQYRCVSSIRNA